jgi:16S rRNA (guanine966-N2)-methyltransferase
MRITGGQHRSRALVAPKGQATRPTSDRVREALFSMLASDGVFSGDGPRVLDLYAGSGALGFEALSRGAQRVVFVEMARPALAAIRENASALGADVEIVALRVDRALATDLGSFDLVLLDPPYADVRENGFAAILDAAGKKVAEGGVLVLEHASSDEPVIADLPLDRRRRHGDTTVSLFRRT